jgi:hypothetical protein
MYLSMNQALVAPSQLLSRLIIGSIVLTTLALAVSFALASYWLVVIICICAGGGWLVAALRNWPSAPTLGLLTTVAATVYGNFEGVSLPGLLIALVAALAAWDTGTCAGRLRATPELAFADDLVRAHVQRLLIVVAVGLLVGSLALLLRVSLSFGWALMLATLAIIGLVRALRFFQRESD